MCLCVRARACVCVCARVCMRAEHRSHLKERMASVHTSYAQFCWVKVTLYGSYHDSRILYSVASGSICMTIHSFLILSVISLPTFYVTITVTAGALDLMNTCLFIASAQ